ncbi:YheC/YheD family endospore coat-associated protein [Cytobacillus purgationiresistens]|uniref:Glutathione synthetase n=1 Tax=Cytobacillus purgationiresistens TaxID=863449 RepID=A0ABU0ACI6_9BACI|nr:YheC/YheD family protein [Cytobacillus purgationiresistens]MDQ0268966.1 hypothetical protein [Cytobacillus purgationiresistens]
MRNRYQIDISDEHSGSVFLPHQLNLDTALYKIAFGTVAIDAKFKQQPDSRMTITISKDIAEELKIPTIKIPLHLFIENETMLVGPLVGIFTSGFTPFPMRPIGERSMFFAKLLSVSKNVGALPFVFGEKHIDWEQGTIKGLFYHLEGWRTIEVPFPNVIYDRLPNRKSERQEELRNVKNRLQTEYLIPWYNPGFFSKMDIYERLQQEDEVTRYLPETQPFTSLSAIETMLSDYGHVYIKPVNGSLGLGIHQIIYDKHEHTYFCRYRDHKVDKNILRKYPSLEALMKHVFGGKKLTRMLVQQGIYLLRKDQRPIDFRVHTNKDEDGNWNVTAMAAKIAGAGSVTTHVKSGGVIKSMSEIFDNDAEKISATEKLKTAVLILSEALDENIEGILGEIGFDLGLDRDGRVWLFEANSKPGRSIFKHPQLKEFDLLTRKLSLAFSIYLTEQMLTKPEEIFR